MLDQQYGNLPANFATAMLGRGAQQGVPPMQLDPATLARLRAQGGGSQLPPLDQVMQQGGEPDVRLPPPGGQSPIVSPDTAPATAPGMAKPMNIGVQGSPVPSATPVVIGKTGQLAGANDYHGGAETPGMAYLSSAGGARVGSQAYAANELARQMAMGMGGSDHSDEAYKMALGQMGSWTDQMQKMQAQQDLARFQQGTVGVEQEKNAIERQHWQDMLDPNKALLTGISQGRIPVQDPESMERMKIALESLAPGAQNAGVGPGLAPGVAKDAAGGMSGPGMMPGAGPAAQPLPSWMKAITIPKDAAGNYATPSGDLFKLLSTKAPPDYLADPANLKQAVDFVDQHSKGGLGGTKAWASYGPYGKTAEQFFSGLRVLGGQPSVSQDDALAASVRNGMGWERPGGGYSPLENWTPGVQLTPFVANAQRLTGINLHNLLGGQ